MMQTEQKQFEQIVGSLTGGTPATREAAARALVAKACQGITRVVSGLVFAEATSANTLSAYRFKNTAGAWMADGVCVIENSADPRTLEDNFDAFELDGSSFNSYISAPAKGIAFAIVGLLAPLGGVGDDVGQMCMILGAEATSPADLTLAQIRAALRVAYPGWDKNNGLVLAHGTYWRSRQDDIVIGGTIAEGDVFTITANDIDIEVTADNNDVAADVADKLRTAATTLLAAEPVTVSGQTTHVHLLADTGYTYTLSVSKASTLGTIVNTNGDAINAVFVDPAANAAALAEREAGSLFSE